MKYFRLNSPFNTAFLATDIGSSAGPLSARIEFHPIFGRFIDPKQLPRIGLSATGNARSLGTPSGHVGGQPSWESDSFESFPNWAIARAARTRFAVVFVPTPSSSASSVGSAWATAPIVA